MYKWTATQSQLNGVTVSCNTETQTIHNLIPRRMPHIKCIPACGFYVLTLFNIFKRALTPRNRARLARLARRRRSVRSLRTLRTSLPHLCAAAIRCESRGAPRSAARAALTRPPPSQCVKSDPRPHAEPARNQPEPAAPRADTAHCGWKREFGGPSPLLPRTAASQRPRLHEPKKLKA